MEFWALAAVSVGTAAVGAYASSRSSRSNTKDQTKAEAEKVKLQGIEDRKSTLFERDLHDYDLQLAKQRKKDARNMTTDKFVGEGKPIKRNSIMVEKPTLPVDKPPETPAGPVKKKKKKGLFSKLTNPLGI